MKVKDMSSILGLFKLEFRQIFLKDDTKGNLYIITATIFLIVSLSFLFIAILGLITNKNIDSIYPAGSLYSTIRKIIVWNEKILIKKQKSIYFNRGCSIPRSEF